MYSSFFRYRLSRGFSSDRTTASLTWIHGSEHCRLHQRKFTSIGRQGYQTADRFHVERGASELGVMPDLLSGEAFLFRSDGAHGRHCRERTSRHSQTRRMVGLAVTNRPSAMRTCDKGTKQLQPVHSHASSQTFDPISPRARDQHFSSLGPVNYSPHKFGSRNWCSFLFLATNGQWNSSA